jgi:hypothetical protein
LRPELTQLPGVFFRRPSNAEGIRHSNMTKISSKGTSVDLTRRDALIAEWRRQGHSLARIAEDLQAAGFAPLSASRLSRIVKETRGAAAAGGGAEEFRKAGLKRLDTLEAALHEKALAGDNAAVDRLLAIMDRRAKLLGVAATPAQAEGSAAEAKETLLRKLDAMAARLAAQKKDAAL